MKILVYGSKDFGRIIQHLVSDCGFEFAGFIDDFYPGPDVVGTYQDVLTNFLPGQFGLINAVGYNYLPERKKITTQILADGYALPRLIHPRSYVAASVQVEEGVIIMAGAIVDVSSHLSRAAVIWPGVVVNHDSVIGENTFLSPNCTICGSVTVGSNCFIGAGAVVTDHVTVPDNFFIKAGCVFKG
ncbi:MAG: acetyltransferase [Deltaproteobacteria bacterium]|nr:acetyltransferase [Deltaproteobacteria bacterium]